MARFDDGELETLKRTTDLAALIRSRGVDLKGAEGGNLIRQMPVPRGRDAVFGRYARKGPVAVHVARVRGDGQRDPVYHEKRRPVVPARG